MSKRHLIIVAGLLAAVGLSGASRHPASGPSARTEGIALGLFASEPNYDYGELLEEMRSRGATDALLVVTWQQDSAGSANIENPLPDAVLRHTIHQARRLGMRVTVMPIVRLKQRSRDDWRGTMNPPVDEWFRGYSALLESLAIIADASGAERLVVGSELATMVVHTDRWRTLIADVRGHFAGRIAYSANWDNYEEIGFWDAVDDVGVTGYFPLSWRSNPTVPELAKGWSEPTARLRLLRERTGKPVLMTEVGYPSHLRAAARPWDQHADPTVDINLQARLYRVFCDEVVARGQIDGYFVWNWFGFGGPNDRSFTPRGKPAAAEIERCIRKH